MSTHQVIADAADLIVDPTQADRDQDSGS